MSVTMDLIQSVGGEWLVIIDETENGGFQCLFPDGKKTMLLVEEQLNWDTHKPLDSQNNEVSKLLSEKQREAAIKFLMKSRGLTEGLRAS